MCCACTTRRSGASSSSSSPASGSIGHVRLRPDRLRAPHIGHGRFALVYDILRRYLESTGVRGAPRLERHRHRRQDHRPRRTRSTGARGGRRRVRGGVVGGDGRTRACLRPTAMPHATAYVDRDGRRSSRELVVGIAYETADGVYLAVVGRRRLRPARPPAPRLAARRRRVESTRRSARRWTSRSGRRRSPASPRGRSPFGDGRPGWHTECVVMALALLGEGFDLHGGGGPRCSPTTRTSGPRRSRSARPSPVTGCTTDGDDGGREDVEVDRQRVDCSLTLVAPTRSPRLPPLRAALPLPGTDRGDLRHSRTPRRPSAGSTPWRRRLTEAGPGEPSRPTPRPRRTDLPDRMDDDLDTPGDRRSLFERASAGEPRLRCPGKLKGRQSSHWP